MKEFINENFLWLIIGGVILLMALIGFIAEKTNFGRGNSEKKNKKKEVENETLNKSDPSEPVVEPIVPSEPIIETNIPDADNIEQTPEVMPEQNTELPVEEDLTVSFDDNTINNEPIIETNVSDADNIEQTPEIMPEQNTELSVEEDLTVPFGDNTINNETVESDNEFQNIIPEEPVNVEEIKEENIDINPKEEDIKLPDIDSIEDEESEEDVWKF